MSTHQGVRVTSSTAGSPVPAADMPHAAAAPVSALPSRAAGTPSPVRAPRPEAGEGTNTSRPAGSPSHLPGGASTSPRDRVRTVVGAEAGSGGVGGTRDAAEIPLPAGSRGLRGAEWQAAVKQAQRRQPGRAAPRAAAGVTTPPVTGGAALTAVATCLGRCDWTAGPGDPAEVDKAANAHATKPPKHATNTVSVIAEIGGAA